MITKFSLSIFLIFHTSIKTIIIIIIITIITINITITISIGMFKK